MTILLFNYVLLSQYGESYINAYGLTATIGVLALFVMVGIAQACQPIISFNHGADQVDKVEQILNLGLKVAIVSGVGFLVTAWLFAHEIAVLFFGDDQSLVALSVKALKLFFLGIPLMGINMVVANLFQATAQPNQATLISLSRGFVFVALGVLLLPMLSEESGIWLSIFFAEAVTAIMSIFMLMNYRISRFRGYQNAESAI